MGLRGSCPGYEPKSQEQLGWSSNLFIILIRSFKVMFFQQTDQEGNIHRKPGVSHSAKVFFFEFTIGCLE